MDTRTTDRAAGTDARPLRADAERNRLRIIAAARDLFAAHGLEVSLDDVADEAGVGIGTVYRRFANRDELITGIFLESLKEVSERASAVVDEPDPWRAVVDLLNVFATSMAQNRGLATIIMRIDPSHPDIETTKQKLNLCVRQVIGRAQEAEVVRPDLAASDVFGFFTMLSAVADVTRDVVPEAWRRYAELLLDAIRADGNQRPVLTTPPLTDAEVQAVQAGKVANCRGQ